LELHSSTLADRGIYFGTSSWKYDGWLGSIYRQDRYLTRGKFSNAKFEQECLSEYAETFPTVCGDLTFYQFPSDEYWANVFNARPDSFVFGFKLPEDIIASIWPKHARYARRPLAVGRGGLFLRRGDTGADSQSSGDAWANAALETLTCRGNPERARPRMRGIQPGGFATPLR
jgi:hypothetical protein